MMKPKAYLVKAGRLPAGSENARGRLSLDNIQFLTAAAAKGEQIDGYSSTTNVVTKEVTVTKVVSNGEQSVVELAPYRYTEDEFQAYELRDGKKVIRSLREACRNTGLSLVGCMCNEHLIVAHDGSGSVRVYVEGK